MSATQDAPDPELSTPSETTQVSLDTYSEIADYLDRLFQVANQPVSREMITLRKYQRFCMSVPPGFPQEEQTWYRTEGRGTPGFEILLKHKTGNKEATKDLLRLIIGMAFETHTVVTERARENHWENAWVNCADRFWDLARGASRKLCSVARPLPDVLSGYL